MSLFQACVLGTLQGLTRFLPVSASGHLVVVPWFLRWTEPGVALNAFLELGTLCALTLCFFREGLGILRGGIVSIIDRRIGFDRDRGLFWLLVLASLPIAIAGA